MKTVTLSQLRKLGACPEQLKRFKKLFGTSVTLSSELVKYAEDFNWNWAANNLLSEAALAEYQHIRGAAWAEFLRVRDAARVNMDRVEGLRVRYAAYLSIYNEAWAECERVKAETFLRLAMQDN